ncbi:MAG TPA: hypothetical protein VMC08_08580 [Bacteroidales bacterium]|nr:hypothetical protein [Bacteroidales bacterium]
MFRKIAFAIPVLFLAGILLCTSCSTPKADKGTLGITVVKGNDGSPVSYELIVLASSLQNLENKVYLDSNWTDANGFFRFHQKDPGIYWYRAKHWVDYGAARVMNGIDSDVILWVNTPDTTVHN